LFQELASGAVWHVAEKPPSRTSVLCQLTRHDSLDEQYIANALDREREVGLSSENMQGGSEKSWGTAREVMPLPRSGSLSLQ